MKAIKISFKKCRTSSWPLTQQWCNGVLPSLSFAITSAPKCNNSSYRKRKKIYWSHQSHFFHRCLLHVCWNLSTSTTDKTGYWKLFSCFLFLLHCHFSERSDQIKKEESKTERKKENMPNGNKHTNPSSHSDTRGKKSEQNSITFVFFLP